MNNLISVNNCPACLSKNIMNIFHQDRFPIILFPVESDNKQNIPSSKLSVSTCKDCDHLFTDSIDVAFNKLIYSDYYYLYPFSNLESMNDKYRAPFHNTFNYVFNGTETIKELLEIGCSDEEQFSFFLEKNISCTGISPGATNSDNVTMIDGFYEEKRFDCKFDYIVSRFNLEHIIDPDRFLSKIRTEMSQDGILLIQVPNEELLLKSGILNIFAHEHTQYFNQKSLRLLLQRNGFDVFLMHGSGEPSLIACARIQKNDFNAGQIYKSNIEVIDQIKQIIQINKDKNIVLYGAGLSLTGLLYNFTEVISKSSKNISVVDDNHQLWGKYMPSSEIVIEKPNFEKYKENTVVFLLLNPIYHNKLIPKLKLGQLKLLYALDQNGLRLV